MLFRRLFASCIVVVLLSLSGPAVSSPPTLEGMTPLVDTFLARTHTPGMIVAVQTPLMPEPLILARGLANVELNVPLHSSMVFRYGSISKVFTALRAKHCISEGKLSSSQDIRSFFPELELREPITVQQLLDHTSGLPELLSLPEVQKYPAKQWSHEELLTLLADTPLLFQPDTRQQYNNTGFLLLALLLDKVEGADNSPGKAWNIPLLHRGNETDIVQNKAYGYTLGNDRLQLPIVLNPSLAYGSGDLVGSVRELLALPRLCRENGMIPPELEAPRLKDGSPAGIPVDYDGLSYIWTMRNGLSLYLFPNQKKYWGKEGMFPGFSTQMLCDPDTESTVILLLNQEKSSFDAFKLGLDILKTLASS